MSNLKHEPIKILRIIARMNLGGPAIQISGLYSGMNKEAFKTILVCGNCEPNEVDFLIETNSSIPVKRLSELGRSVSIFNDLKALLSLIRIIRKENPHIIHTHTAKAGVLGRIASILSFRRSLRVHTFHGHLLKGYFRGIKLKIILSIEFVLSLITHRLIAVGDVVREDLLSVGIGKRDKFLVFQPGVLPPRTYDKFEMRSEFSIPNDALVISFVGRIERIKRPDRFIEVAEKVTIACPDSNLVFLVAGEGNLLEETKEAARLRNLPIRFLGWIPTIEKVLSASDLVLLTSENEGIPMSLIQSSFCAIPAVATNVGSVREVVIDSETGKLCNEDTLELSASVVELIRDENLRNRLGQSAKRLAFEKFHVSRLVADHENLYSCLIKNRAN